MERMAEFKITRFDNHPSGSLGRVEYTGAPRWGFVIDKNHAPHFWCAVYTEDGREVGTSFLHEIVGAEGLDTLPNSVVGATVPAEFNGQVEIDQSAEVSAAYIQYATAAESFAANHFGGVCPHSLIHD